MGIKEALATTRTARRVEETIDPAGAVLFVEPCLAAVEAVQKKYMKYNVSTVGKKSTVTVDTERSNMPAHNRALVALTVRDPGTEELVFSGEAEVAETFSAKDESGASRHGSELFQEFVKHTNVVCGLSSEDEDEDDEDHLEN